MDIDRHRDEIRRLLAEAPDEPTYCEFKQALSYATPKEKAELVKDVSSFANADLEALDDFGYTVFGVANDGRIVGVADNAGDPLIPAAACFSPPLASTALIVPSKRARIVPNK